MEGTSAGVPSALYNLIIAAQPDETPHGNGDRSRYEIFQCRQSFL